MKDSTKVGLFYGTVLCVLGGFLLVLDLIGPPPHFSLSGLSLVILGLIIDILCLTKNYPNTLNHNIFK